jgi:hypothetical protein
LALTCPTSQADWGATVVVRCGAAMKFYSPSTDPVLASVGGGYFFLSPTVQAVMDFSSLGVSLDGDHLLVLVLKY